MKARRFASLRLAALVLTATACSGGGVGKSGQAIKPAVGYNVSTFAKGKRWKPKGFSGPALLVQGDISNALLAGKVSVVNFWASWCGPCRQEQRQLEAVWKAYESKGVRFLGINIRDTRTDALAHLDEYGVTYPSVFNPDSTIAFTYRVLSVPTTYVLDASGGVAARITGATTESSRLDSILDAELAP